MFNPCRHVKVSDSQTLAEKCNVTTHELTDGRVEYTFTCKKCSKIVGVCVRDVWKD
jgi:hypothetical protein